MAIDRVASLSASRRHLTHYADVIALVMRQCVNLIVAVVVLTVPLPTAAPTGRAVLVCLAGWAIYRLSTRALARWTKVVDYALTVAVCLELPALVPGPTFYTANSAPVAIAGTAVISFSVSLPARWSSAAAAGIASPFAVGAVREVGWSHVLEIYNLYYFALQWATSVLIRHMVIRVADAVDDARAQRHTAELAEQISRAVRDYDRDQVRLLHDTVASTLMMVGQGIAIPANRLAAQATRDLKTLDEMPAVIDRPRADLVAGLREEATYSRTPLRWSGVDSLLLDGAVAHQVVAAAREALNNVDRHACASFADIAVTEGCLTIRDDGVGFDPAAAGSGTGIAQSIVARMRHVGGTASIKPGVSGGTTVEIGWPAVESEPTSSTSDTDPDQLIERTRIGYGLALSAYGVANLAAATAAAVPHTDRPTVQVLLAGAAALTTLAAIPGILGRRRIPPWLAVISSMAVALAQSAALPPGGVGGQANWSQSVVGWCLLPHLLRQPVRDGAGALILTWAIPAAYALLRDPTAATAFNIGLGSASILGVQLFALAFNELIREASDRARAETTTYKQAVARQHVSDAVHTEYRRRYASLIDNVRPVLAALADRAPVDIVIRRRAQIETQKLRALFEQSAIFEHPIMRAARAAVDAAAERGVDVCIHADRHLADVRDDDALRIATHLASALDITNQSARIVLAVEENQVVASITCTGLRDTESLIACPALDDDDDVQLTAAEGVVWLTIRCDPTEGHMAYGSAARTSV